MTPRQGIGRGAHAAAGPRPSRAARALAFVVDTPWALIGLAAFVALCVWIYGTRTQPHHVRAAFDSAVSIAPGLDVQIDGVDVGKVSKVSYDDGQAIVELGIDDDAWPLHQGATAAIRFGTTLGNGTRRIDVEPGDKSRPALSEDAVLTTKSTVTPVEFDELFDTFDARTRRSFKGFFAGGADNLEGRAGQLNAGLGAAAPAFEATGDLLSDVARDELALRRLVVTGHRATRTLAAKRPVISDLMTVMAQTMDAFARNSDGIRASLDQFAPTLRATRTTLARTDSSIDILDGLLGDLRPGVRELHPFLATARPAARDLARLAPLATQTVRTLRTAAPPTTEFLKEGVPFSRQLKPVLDQFGNQLSCVRPYMPEIAAWASNWSSWAKGYDNDSHYGRIKAVTGATAFSSYPPTSTPQFLGTSGSGLSYAMPRPPGYNDDKPWFLPQCGITEDALDPSKDPEDR